MVEACPYVKRWAKRDDFPAFGKPRMDKARDVYRGSPSMAVDEKGREEGGEEEEEEEEGKKVAVRLIGGLKGLVTTALARA